MLDRRDVIAKGMATGPSGMMRLHLKRRVLKPISYLKELDAGLAGQIRSVSGVLDHPQSPRRVEPFSIGAERRCQPFRTLIGAFGLWRAPSVRCRECRPKCQKQVQLNPRRCVGRGLSPQCLEASGEMGDPLGISRASNCMLSRS